MNYMAIISLGVYPGDVSAVARAGYAVSLGLIGELIFPDGSGGLIKSIMSYIKRIGRR